MLAFPVFLFLYLQAKGLLVRHEMMEKLEHARLQTIVVHNDDIEWYEKGREIIVGGVMFDVHDFLKLKDSTIFTGLFDTEETAIKHQVKKLLERTNENGARELVIGKLMLQLWLSEDESVFPESNLSFTRAQQHGRFSESLLSADLSIPLPPPRVVHV